MRALLPLFQSKRPVDPCRSTSLIRHPFNTASPRIENLTHLHVHAVTTTYMYVYGLERTMDHIRVLKASYLCRHSKAQLPRSSVCIPTSPQTQKVLSLRPSYKSVLQRVLPGHSKMLPQPRGVPPPPFNPFSRSRNPRIKGRVAAVAFALSCVLPQGWRPPFHCKRGLLLGARRVFIFASSFRFA